jgi:acetyl esterase/lipase
MTVARSVVAFAFALLAPAAWSGAAAQDKKEPPPFKVPDNVEMTRDVEYGKAGSFVLKMDVFQPNATSDKPRPAILSIHGGGWTGGTKDEGHRFLQGSAVSGKYACFTIDYRLTGRDKVTWPAAIHDCKAAVRYLRANAKQLNIDPERIGVVGHSAGGHLTAMLATTGDVKELEGDSGSPGVSSRITCGIAMAGVYDFTAYVFEFKRDKTRTPWISPLEVDSAEYRLFGGPLDQKKDVMKMASPVTHASKDDAPLLIGHGSEDAVAPFDQAKPMYEAMKAAGATAYYAPVMGSGHPVAGSEFAGRRTDFFRKYLLDEKVEISNEPITLPKE